MDSLLNSSKLPEKHPYSRKRRPVLGFLLMLMGRLLHFLGGMLLFLTLVGATAVIFAFLEGNDKFGHQDVFDAMRAAVSSLAFSLALYGGGLSCYQKGKKLRIRTADEELQHDKRAPVLYLRSFRSDLLGARNIDYERKFLTLLSPRRLIFPPLTEEEQVARVFTKLGPFITIGSPEDEGTTLGASRFYVPPDNWRESVIDILRRAQLVVVRIGAGGEETGATFLVLNAKTTPGLTWELLISASSVSQKHVVLLVGCDANEYTSYKTQVQKAFPKGLPEFVASDRLSSGSIRGLIVFADDWSPRFLAIIRRDLSPFRPVSYPLVSAIAGKLVSLRKTGF